IAPACCYRANGKASSLWPHALLAVTSDGCTSRCIIWLLMLRGVMRRFLIGVWVFWSPRCFIVIQWWDGVWVRPDFQKRGGSPWGWPDSTAVRLASRTTAE